MILTLQYPHTKVEWDTETKVMSIYQHGFLAAQVFNVTYKDYYTMNYKKATAISTIVTSSDF